MDHVELHIAWNMAKMRIGMNSLKENEKKEHPSIGTGTRRKEKIQQDNDRHNIDGGRDWLGAILCYFFTGRIWKGKIHFFFYKKKKNDK